MVNLRSSFQIPFCFAVKVKLNFPHRLIQLLIWPVTFPALSDPQLILSRYLSFKFFSQNVIYWALASKITLRNLPCFAGMNGIKKHQNQPNTQENRNKSRLNSFFWLSKKPKQGCKLQRLCCLRPTQLW